MDRKQVNNRQSSGHKGGSQLSWVISQARSLGSLNQLVEQLETYHFSEEELVTFLSTLLTQRDRGFQKIQHFSMLISSSEKLKHTIKNTFFAKGKLIMKLLLATSQAEESRNIEILRALCVFFSSYHLKNYNIDESMVSSLIHLCASLANEQKSRLALNCLADLLMKLPQFSPLAFPFLFDTFLELTHPSNLTRGFGSKLFFSVLRSVYYCLISEKINLAHRQVLTLFLGLRKIFNINTGETAEDAYFLGKARAFGLQTLQNLYKENSKILYPFLGVYFRGPDCLINLFKKESYQENRLVIIRSIAIILDSTPFVYFQLSKDLAVNSCLFELSVVMVRRIGAFLLKTMDSENTEEGRLTCLKLATSLLKCPTPLFDTSQMFSIVKTIQKLREDKSQSIKKQSLLSLVPAYSNYSELLSEQFQDFSWLLVDDDFLCFKLSLVKEIVKHVRSESLLPELFKLMQHKDYRVKNSVFDIMTQFSKPNQVITCKVFAELKKFIHDNNPEGVIPSLSYFDFSAVALVSCTEAQQTTSALFSMISKNPSNLLLIGKSIRFFSLLIKNGYLEAEAQDKVMALLTEHSSSSNMGVLSCISVSLANLTASTHLVGSAVLKITLNLCQGNKTSLFSHLMQAMNSMLSQYTPAVLKPRAQEIATTVLKCIEFKKTNVSLAACTALNSLIEKTEDLGLNADSILENLLGILKTHDNYKTKIEVCRPILLIVAPRSYDKVLRAVVEQLETEKNKVYCDFYLSANHAKYKEELFWILVHVLLMDKIRLVHVKGFLVKHLSDLLRWIHVYLVENGARQKKIKELSGRLRHWLSVCIDIPVSFYSYDWLEIVSKGEIDESFTGDYFELENNTY